MHNSLGEKFFLRYLAQNTNFIITSLALLKIQQLANTNYQK